MPRLKQEIVAEKLIINSKLDKPLTGGEIVASSGYGVSMRKNPQVILNSKGVKEALKARGFTEDNAKKVVQSIMLNKNVDPSARLKATDQVFKVHGSYAPEKHLNINIETSKEELEKANKALLEIND